MDKGFRYTYSVAAFPRVKYFQQRLKRAIPRWKRILDAGGLPDCISQGEVKLGTIMSLAQVIGEKVSINVFANFVFLKTSTLGLRVLQIGDEGTDKISWSSFSDEKEKSFMTAVTVIVLPSLEEKNIKGLEAKMSGISKALLPDIIIYIEETKTNFMYTDLVNVNFQQEDIDLSEDKACDRSKCLNKQIQNVLEEKIVAVLDMMAAYNKVFIPKKCEDPEESLQDTVHIKLLKSLRDPFVVKDLSGENISELREESQAATTDSERDAVFHRKLLDFVAKKTKCVSCDTLSKKYGISTNLINEFLNEGFFGYEKKVAEMMAAMSLPCWPPNKLDNGVSTCRSFAHKCSLSMSKITSDSEEYIKTKSEILMLVKKLQFELFGLLEQTDVAIETKIPNIPKLPADLQHALLQIPEVYGCGTIWGELELHLTTDLTPDSKDILKELLLTHHYTYSYTTLVIQQPKPQYRQGTGLLARNLEPNAEGEYKCGSLGCFIYVKQARATSATANVLQQSKLHCITCAHCVLGCAPMVQIRNSNQDLEDLGSCKDPIFRPEAIDVAVIEIHQDKEESCNTSLKDSTQSVSPNWSFFNGTPTKRSVFKYGSVTGFTEGICTSADYKTRMIHKWNQLLGNKQLPQFDADYNILIGPKVDILQGTVVEGLQTAPAAENMQHDDENSKKFSDEGDSGSVVCNDDPETGDVVVISVLCGDIKKPVDGGPDQWMYTYSTSIKNVLSELEEKFTCSIEPACSQEV